MLTSGACGLVGQRPPPRAIVRSRGDGAARRVRELPPLPSFLPPLAHRNERHLTPLSTRRARHSFVRSFRSLIDAVREDYGYNNAGGAGADAATGGGGGSSASINTLTGGGMRHVASEVSIVDDAPDSEDEVTRRGALASSEVCLPTLEKDAAATRDVWRREVSRCQDPASEPHRSARNGTPLVPRADGQRARHADRRRRRRVRVACPPRDLDDECAAAGRGAVAQARGAPPRERERENVCVREKERKRERERGCVCVCV